MYTNQSHKARIGFPCREASNRTDDDPIQPCRHASTDQYRNKPHFPASFFTSKVSRSIHKYN